MSKNDVSNYSAEVDIWLDCGELGIIPLSQASSTFVIADTAIDLPACEARIILKVDSRKYERKVTLVNGMSQTSRQAMILSSDGVSPF
jgi:hypothetical protein